jgi:hypothetical protein
MIIKHRLGTGVASERNEKLVKGQPRTHHLQNIRSKYGTVFTVDRIKFPLSNTVGYHVQSPTGILYTCSCLKEMKAYINRGDKTVVESGDLSVDN